MKSLSLNQMATTQGNGGPTFNNNCNLCDYGNALIALYYLGTGNPLLYAIGIRFVNLHCTGRNNCGEI